MEKPVDPKDLREAVAKAIKLTAERRRTARVESAVKELGRTQQWMLNAPKQAAVDIELSFQPILEAGGDFFSHFPVATDRYLCLLTDVSGHDLKAAYVSAYFQGVVRGMLERNASVSEVLGAFNRFLLEDWNQPAATNVVQAMSTTSVACCSVLLDLKSHRACVHISGLPAPILVKPDGRAHILGAGGGYPLGWFEDYVVPEVEYAAPGGSAFLMWTDGLADLAEREGVTPLSLGYALQSSRAAGLKLAELARATDDLLFARVRLPVPELTPDSFHPLVVELYAGSEAGDIDRLSEVWLRSLQLAVPELSEVKLHDLMLASREALLNGLKHGCQGCSEMQAFFQISFHPGRNEFRVWVEDPGTGHDFDVVAHEGSANGQLVDEHRGLMLMNYLANTLRTERRGASVVMDFIV
ncbi:MAG: SpoIIE family protein phosphatase [Verrucomicrobiota bacterium]